LGNNEDPNASDQGIWEPALSSLRDSVHTIHTATGAVLEAAKSIPIPIPIPLVPEVGWWWMDDTPQRAGEMATRLAAAAGESLANRTLEDLFQTQSEAWRMATSAGAGGCFALLFGLIVWLFARRDRERKLEEESQPRKQTRPKLD